MAATLALARAIQAQNCTVLRFCQLALGWSFFSMVKLSMPPIATPPCFACVYPTATRTSSSLDTQSSPAKTPLVACIHQDLTTFQVSKATFSQYPQKIEVVFLNDAQNALSHLFEIKPDLICCDLASSSSALDGYDFCAMLRRVVRPLPHANYCL